MRRAACRSATSYGYERIPSRVRIRVVSLLEDAELIPMMSDSDYYVRLVIARRVHRRCCADDFDEETEVRRVVAQRIQHDWLLQMRQILTQLFDWKLRNVLVRIFFPA